MRTAPQLLVLVLALSGAGCSKKSSKEFHKLAADQEILVTRDGDDAWASAEMDAIAQGLAAVPVDALEKPKADALVAKIAAEKARVLAEREANQPPPRAPVEPPSFQRPSEPTPSEPVADGPAAEAEDAGRAPLPEPVLGQPEADFVAKFGACFSRGPATKLSSGADATGVQQLNKSADCLKRFNNGQAGGTVLYLFGPKGLAEKATLVETVVDGGQQVIPGRQPPAPDPGPPVFTIQGAPPYPAVGADGGS